MVGFAALGLQYLFVYIGLYPKACVLVECVEIGLTESLPGTPFFWASKSMVSQKKSFPDQSDEVSKIGEHVNPLIIMMQSGMAATLLTMVLSNSNDNDI